MRERPEPLALMSARERESYLDWLARVAKGRRGTLPDFFRKAAQQLRDQWSMS
jgi:hypothetical protein